jgi:hypothetical protein
VLRYDAERSAVNEIVMQLPELTGTGTEWTGWGIHDPAHRGSKLQSFRPATVSTLYADLLRSGGHGGKPLSPRTPAARAVRPTGAVMRLHGLSARPTVWSGHCRRFSVPAEQR